jgi:GAF domain-containing protein
VAEPLPTEAPSPPPEAAVVLAPLGGVLLSTETVASTVELVTRLAVETIPDTVGAGVTLVDDRGQRSTAASNAFVAEVDALQYALDSGPCLTAWSDQSVVRIDDLAVERRWPEWTAAAAGLGLRAMLSVPLKTTDASVGAIKVYSRRPGAYDSRAEHVLGLFAQQAAALLANMVALADARRLSAQLTEALQSRDAIGQAKGILMARGAPDEQAAFAFLVTASQRSNLKVTQVARQLVDSVLSRHGSPRPPS